MQLNEYQFWQTLKKIIHKKRMHFLSSDNVNILGGSIFHWIFGKICLRLIDLYIGKIQKFLKT